ncbi:chorismate-binding protein [Streptomyces turgidiscabies]|uniref:chorismate-binding protein n=1 Tax=Streptomyces TaxID=1883 RepID=UPI0019D6D19E|nr:MULTISPECIES: chorismate-binding protein [Streptomyces]MDX2549104.1 chorismate-binding protein [Streptomyces sp. WI04-05B]MDX2590397.1 chorismate-binding protein [Streptomyces sp. WI04-05A]MDX3499861.1 chorismate-binding protein [Streptomyces turgidiscabies]
MISDARRYARPVLAGHRLEAPLNTVFSYGSRRRVVVGLGSTGHLEVTRGVCSLSLPGLASREATTPQSLLAGLQSFFEATDGRWIMGYIGFGAHHSRYSTLAVGPDPEVLLFTPESVLVIKDDGSASSASGPMRLPRGRRATKAGSPPPLADETVDRFRVMVDDVLGWVGQEPGRRLTVATRHGWSGPVDLVSTMAAGQDDSHGVSRSFYCHHGGLEFAGTSPELLIDGSLERFTCHKLSGTSGHTRDGRRPAPWDLRLVEEHRSSIDSLLTAYSHFASVSAGPPEFLRLEELVHGMTRLTVEPKPGSNPAGVLLGALPTGASPAEGLSEIAKLEQFPRGPYYGMVGCAAPDGRLQWSQLLRSVFQRDGRVWLPVGAAVTARSSPDVEAAEIALKARSVRVAWHS